MGVNIRPIDLDERFKQIRAPIVINDVSQISAKGREGLSERTVRVIEGETLTSVPSCDCEAITGMDNHGVICPQCGTEVTDSSNKIVESQIWIKAPKGISSLILPNFLAMLMDMFSKKKNAKTTCIISWLLDTGSHPPTLTPQMEAMLARGFKRGYEEFLGNYERTIIALFDVHGRDWLGSDLRVFMETYRHLLFPQHLPVIHKSLVIVEKNAMGTYADKSMVEIHDVIKIMSGIDADDDINGYAAYMKERRVAKAVLKIAGFLSTSITELMGKKPALWRQHCYGTRTHFAIRCVISSITDVHKYDEVRLPWSASIGMLRLHLTSKLQERGYTPRQIDSMLTQAVYQYDPLIDELFKEIIAQAYDGCLYCIVLRNPSLHRPSVQLLKVRHIKTDPKDTTMGISILNVKGFNADHRW